MPQSLSRAFRKSYRSPRAKTVVTRHIPNYNGLPLLLKYHTIYFTRITCKRGNCEVLPSSYIGMTTKKLSRRLTCHLTSGAPKSHLLEKHGIIITTTFLEENTELVDMCADVRRLPILEALYIKEINPKLNVQANDLQALPSMKRTKANNSLLTEKQSEESTANKRLPLTETR
ncbi:hypothetical protein GWK47_026777 [Chionoecetes opilio]|uniref:GIY-YIG domain-containing protein n=1 Tax=Chionoecetes opilio TaxID=41210 RepID=A0A8J8WEF2_CHIOP|nr:hypothetical protein GWK47_026777 [Chionoecetes opilio]